VRTAPTPARSSIALGLSLLMLLAIAAACGDTDSGSAAADPKKSSSSSAVDAGFRTRAEAVCAPYAEFEATNFLDLARFNQYAPDPALLPEVATHLEQIPAYQTLVADLEDLGAPDSGATSWDVVLDDFRENAHTVAGLIEAAHAADAAQFAQGVGQLEQDKSQLFADLATAGLGGSSCAAAEVDPLKPPLGSE
jgi:hypothetical protein